MAAETTDLKKLHAEIEALSPPDRLRLAAGLLEQKRPEMAAMAKAIVDRVAIELGADMARALRGAQ